MNYCFKNLVFEGGGVKGVAYGGALNELDRLNLLKSVERVAGTSAGAITACLLAVGYTPEDITQIISRTNFSKFEDNTFGIFRDLKRLIFNYGWNKGEVFQRWIGELISIKTGHSDFTFEDLYTQRKECGYKDLYIVCSNITRQKADILSYETTPSLPIRDAVRMSMSIPIFFAAVKNESGDVIVDGGVTMNYPINIFDNVKYLSNPSNGTVIDYGIGDTGQTFNYETLGFRVDSTEEKNYLLSNWDGDKSATKNLKNFIGSLIVFMMEMANKKHLQKNDWNRTIFIDSGTIKATDFDLKEKDINLLINNGKNAVQDYFHWRDNDLRWSNIPKC